MYLRKNTRTYKDRTYVNYLLVESMVTDKGPRQKVICSLGDLSPRPRSEWLDLARRVEVALDPQSALFPAHDPEVDAIVRHARERSARLLHAGPSESAPSTPGHPPESPSAEDEVVAVRTKDVRTERVRQAGPVHVGYQFWRRLGLDEILADVGLTARARVITCAMVLNRLCQPAAEHAMPGWLRTTALDDILGTGFDDLADDALYRNLDRLHPNRAAIEQALVERERTLFNLDRTVYLYDLTSTYFEGQANQIPKAKRGYSRDHRPDCKQVVIGLVVNRDGFPIAHEILEGNRQDRTTLKDMLALLDRRIGLSEGQTIVVDRGMAFDENLAEITSRKLHYLVAARHPERDQWLAEFDDEQDWHEVVRMSSPRNPHQKKSKVEVKQRRTATGTYILCVSEGRVSKDQAIREKHEQRLLADLAKLKRSVASGKKADAARIHQQIGRLKERYPRVARYYAMEYDAERGCFSYELDAARKSKAQKLDGSYLLKTDREDVSADEAWQIYTLLTRAEDAFRDLKTPLAERPIFHKVERRVETHIFLCVLAYHLLVAIEKTLLDRGVHTSWPSVRLTISTHQVVTVVLPTADGRELRIRRASSPEPEHMQLYTDLAIPSEIIRPQRTWCDAPRTNEK